MSESLAELVAADQTQTVPVPETPSESVPESSTPPVETPPAETPPEETPAQDPFLTAVAERTGMDVSKFKDQDAFIDSFANLQRKLSERDELNAFARQILENPKAIEALASLNKPPETPPASPPSSGVPEYDPSWDALENPPPEIAAKRAKFQAWQRERAESLIKSEFLAKLAQDPEGAIAGLLDKRLAPVEQQLNQSQQERAEQARITRLNAIYTAHSADLFKDGNIANQDESNLTPIGQAAAEMYQAGKDNVKDDLAYFEQCLSIAKRLHTPTPKPTKQPSQAASRAPAVGAPPADTRTVEQVLAEAPPNLSLADLQALANKALGLA